MFDRKGTFSSIFPRIRRNCSQCLLYAPQGVRNYEWPQLCHAQFVIDFVMELRNLIPASAMQNILNALSRS